MTSKKATGTGWETAVVNYLRSQLGSSQYAYKPRQEGHTDVGDIHVDADFVLQCKNWKTWSKQDLYNFVDAANEQAIAAKRAYGAACVKRRKAPGSSGSVQDGLIIMDLDTFTKVVHDLQDGREALSRLEDISEGDY